LVERNEGNEVLDSGESQDGLFFGHRVNVSSFFNTGSFAKNILVVSFSSLKMRTADPVLNFSFTVADALFVLG